MPLSDHQSQSKNGLYISFQKVYFFTGMRWFAVLGARQRKTPPRKGRGPSAEYLARRDGLVPCSGSETHGENLVLLTLNLIGAEPPDQPCKWQPIILPLFVQTIAPRTPHVIPVHHEPYLLLNGHKPRRQTEISTCLVSIAALISDYPPLSAVTQCVNAYFSWWKSSRLFISTFTSILVMPNH